MDKRFSTALAGLSFLILLEFTGCASRVTGLTPAQIAILQQQGFHPISGGWELGLSDKVLFATNSDTLNPTTHTAIEQLGRSLLSVQIAYLRIEGHTDNYGTDAYNDDLSLRRANAVAGVLEEAGMIPANLQVRGLGKLDPIADNNTPTGQSENRRVAIIVSSDQGQ
jgi:outer membrane protein OmpA-like peptidoglycan-associated protein